MSGGETNEAMEKGVGDEAVDAEVPERPLTEGVEYRRAGETGAEAVLEKMGNQA